MAYIVFALLWFSMTVAIHVALHRWLVPRGIRTAKTLLIYGAGQVIAVIVLLLLSHTPGSGDHAWWTVPLPWTGIVLYFFLSTTIAINLVVAIWADQALTTTIMSFLAQRSSASLKTVVHAFVRRSFVHKRLHDLRAAGFIIDRDRRYSLTPLGRWASRAINVYCWLFQWQPSG